MPCQRLIRVVNRTSGFGKSEDEKIITTANLSSSFLPAPIPHSHPSEPSPLDRNPVSHYPYPPYRSNPTASTATIPSTSTVDATALNADHNKMVYKRKDYIYTPTCPDDLTEVELPDNFGGGTMRIDMNGLIVVQIGGNWDWKPRNKPSSSQRSSSNSSNEEDNSDDSDTTQDTQDTPSPQRPYYLGLPPALKRTPPPPTQHNPHEQAVGGQGCQNYSTRTLDGIGPNTSRNSIGSDSDFTAISNYSTATIEGIGPNTVYNSIRGTDDDFTVREINTTNAGDTMDRMSFRSSLSIRSSIPSSSYSGSPVSMSLAEVASLMPIPSPGIVSPFNVDTMISEAASRINLATAIDTSSASLPNRNPASNSRSLRNAKFFISDSSESESEDEEDNVEISYNDEEDW